MGARNWGCSWGGGEGSAGAKSSGSCSEGSESSRSESDTSSIRACWGILVKIVWIL